MERYPLISIIVPVYNVEKYLYKCIDSICNQTYKNLEIILVNDGSQDKSPSICDKYMARDIRVKVIHKTNGGLSDARNCGLDIASGEYVGFVDSDDWVDNDMYEILLNNLIDNDADLAECGMKLHYPDGSIINEENTEKYILTNKDALRMFLTQKIDIKGTVTNKLYHKSIFSKIRFPVGRLHEDGYYTYKAIYLCKKFVKINLNRYNYIQDRPDSIMTKTVGKKNIVDVVDAFEERNQFFLEKEEYEIYEQAKSYYYRTVLTYYLYCKKNLSREEELIAKLYKILIDSKVDILKSKYLGIKKIKFIIFFIFKSFLSL